jgi:hypothetical protein
MNGGKHAAAATPPAEAGVPVGDSIGEDLDKFLWSLEHPLPLPGNPGLGGKSLAEDPLWDPGLWDSEWDLLPNLTGSDWPAAALNQATDEVDQVYRCVLQSIFDKRREKARVILPLTG